MTFANSSARVLDQFVSVVLVFLGGVLAAATAGMGSF
jgi:hypothetical protein